ncbi:MAG: Ig-like domain-containing protein, partial [Thermomicrobiales bacterium]
MGQTWVNRRLAGVSSWLLFVMLASLLLSLWPAPPPAAAAPVPTYTLNLSATSGGSVQASPTGPTYPAGTVVTLTATANANFLFTGWSTNGVLQSWASPWTIRMDADRTISATFVSRPTFSDLPSDPRYTEAIQQLAARGVIKGHQDTQTCAARGLAAPCFLPYDSIIRAEESALIVRAMGWSNATSTAAPFSDIGMVDPELQRAIAILFNRHIIVGYGNHLFGPLDDVLHIQAVSFITRAMVQAGYWQAVTQDDPTIYPNVPLSSGGRLDLLTFVKYAGPIIDRPIHQNWDDWNTPATRAWCAELIWQALNAFFGGNHPPGNTAPVASDDSYTTAEDTPLTVDAAHGVLANDSDAQHDVLRAVLVTNPAHGALALNADGSFIYTPDLHYNGPDSFTYKANDGSLDSNVATVAITVSHINQPPSFTRGADQTVLENAGAQTVTGWATNISAGPPDESGQTLTFVVTNNTNAALFSAGPAIAADGTLTYTPATNANGAATITIVLKDNGGTVGGGQDTSPPQTFVITVTSVNQPPTFTVGPNQSVPENVGAQTVNPWATNISPGAANESGQTVTFNVTNNDNPALFSAGPAISPTGVLTYTPATDTIGTATITIVLQDNGGTAN